MTCVEINNFELNPQWFKANLFLFQLGLALNRLLWFVLILFYFWKRLNLYDILDRLDFATSNFYKMIYFLIFLLLYFNWLNALLLIKSSFNNYGSWNLCGAKYIKMFTTLKSSHLFKSYGCNFLNINKNVLIIQLDIKISLHRSIMNCCWY